MKRIEQNIEKQAVDGYTYQIIISGNAVPLTENVKNACEK